MKNLVIGLGNILCCDDGIGIHILKSLEKRNKIADAQYLDLGTSSLDVCYHITDDLSKIAVIDCLKNSSCNAGDVFKFSVDDLKKNRSSRYSLHQLEFVDSISLISITEKLPETAVFAVASKDIDSISMEISDSLKKRFDEIVQKIEKEIIIFFRS